jgi:hypothetical protein
MCHGLPAVVRALAARPAAVNALAGEVTALLEDEEVRHCTSAVLAAC